MLNVYEEKTKNTAKTILLKTEDNRQNIYPVRKRFTKGCELNNVLKNLHLLETWVSKNIAKNEMLFFLRSVN